MRLLFCVMFSFFIMKPAISADPSLALGGGLSFTKVDTDGSTGAADEELSANLNIGARALFGINEELSFRTGIYLQEKSAKYSIDTKFMGVRIDGDITARVISAALPLNLQYKINDMFSIFGGYALDYTINDYCKASGDFDSCETGNVKSLVHNAMIGASIWGNDKLDVDVQYQHGLSDVYEDAKIHTFMAQLFVKF